MIRKTSLPPGDAAGFGRAEHFKGKVPKGAFGLYCAGIVERAG